MSPSKIITRWVDRFGVQPVDRRAVVAYVRISKIGWWTWEWEVWWVRRVDFRVAGTLNYRTRFIMDRFAGHGRAPTRWQCAAISSRFVASRSRLPTTTRSAS